MSCATFISGPFRPPSAAASCDAFFWRSVPAEQVVRPDPRRDSSDIGAHLRIALHAPREAVAFAVAP